VSAGRRSGDLRDRCLGVSGTAVGGGPARDRGRRGGARPVRRGPRAVLRPGLHDLLRRDRRLRGVSRFAGLALAQPDVIASTPEVM